MLYLGLDQDIAEDYVPGTSSWLPGEDDAKMIPLSMIKNCWGEQVSLYLICRQWFLCDTISISNSFVIVREAFELIVCANLGSDR